MHGPAKNRLHDYEAEWLTFLVKTGLATSDEAQAAQARVMHDELARLAKRRERRERRGPRRRKGDGEGE